MATELFVSRSYAGTSLIDVARGAGVATRTISQHFGDKDAIFEGVVFARDTGTIQIQNRNGFSAWHVAAKRWEFVRTNEGWRIAKRTNRLLDGSEKARALLGQSFDEFEEILPQVD